MGTDAIYDKHSEVFLLWACRETGVIQALLDGVTDAEAIVERTGITERAASTVLDALADLGYTQVTGETYEPTGRLRGFDPETRPLERGILPHRVDTFEDYMHLPEKMRGTYSSTFSDEEFRNYMGGMATVGESTVRSIVTAAEHAHPRPDRVLNVGGGPGRFAAEFGRRGAEVTLVDRESVLNFLEDHHREKGLDVVVGDARDSLPTGFDLVFSARMTVSLTLAEIQEYFANAFDALDPGGTFVGAEWVRGRSEVADRFGLHMLAISDVGNTYTESEYRSALEEAGFVGVEVREVPDSRYQTIVGQVPQSGL
ncbi:methyltransferase domain-containing protein [Halodesulfurarchaeum sp.]|uniref:methyltransferase domain-containing protein n=1 Tax=Halodesulfurarchaeum sp. TaxID=1980530 RepID=UPI002FC328C8